MKSLVFRISIQRASFHSPLLGQAAVPVTPQALHHVSLQRPVFRERIHSLVHAAAPVTEESLDHPAGDVSIVGEFAEEVAYHVFVDLSGKTRK